MQEPPAKTSFLDAIAVACSWILNPLIMPGLVYALLLFQFGATRDGILHGFGLGLLFFAVIPGIGILWLRHKGEIESFDIRTKEKRVKPMLIGLSCNLLALAIVFQADFPSQVVILATTLSFLVVGLLVFVITRSWKISIHLSTYAGLVLALFVFNKTGLPSEAWAEHLFGPGGLRELPQFLSVAILFGAPLLMWARVRCKVHSWSQVVVGLVMGLVVHGIILVVTQELIGL